MEVEERVVLRKRAYGKIIIKDLQRKRKEIERERRREKGQRGREREREKY